MTNAERWLLLGIFTIALGIAVWQDMWSVVVVGVVGMITVVMLTDPPSDR